jgi:hypothetical protein
MWWLQLMKASRPSHKTPRPTKFNISMVAEVASSRVGGEMALFLAFPKKTVHSQ